MQPSPPATADRAPRRCREGVSCGKSGICDDSLLLSFACCAGDRRTRVGACLIAKRHAQNDPLNQYMRFVVVLLEIGNDPVHGTRIFEGQTATQSVPQHLVRQMTDEKIFLAEQHGAELIGSVERRTVWQYTLGVDRFSGVLGAPPPQNVVIFQTEADRVDAIVARST